MELREFIEIMHSDVDAFEKYWLVSNKARSAHYPMEMSEGEWYEQFIAFESVETS